MSLDLPPRRPLPAPERMLREILDDTAAEPTGRPRRRAVLTGVLVAAAALGVTAVAVPVVLHRVGTVAATPSPTAQASGPVHPTPVHPTPVHPTTGTLALGDWAELPYVRVTVREATTSLPFGALVLAEVCVRGLPPDSTGDTLQVGWTSWTVTNVEGSATAELRQGPRPSKPPKLLPREADLRVGDCVSGWIPFNADEHSPVQSVRYSDALGETAAWDGS